MAKRVSISRRAKHLTTPERTRALFEYVKWGKMLSRAQLFASLRSTLKTRKKPYSICAWLSEITQCQFEDD